MAIIITVSWIFFWIFLPLTLLAGVLFRYNLLSCIYLMLVLILPFSSFTKQRIRSCVAYTFAVAVISGVFLLAHVGFQIALFAKSPYGSLIGEPCTQWESIARYIGFNRFDNVDVDDVIRLLLPDIVVFLMSLVSLALIRKTIVALDEENVDVDRQSDKHPKFSSTKRRNGLVLCMTILFLALAGIAYPNLVSCIYFLVFISLTMAWAVHAPLLVPAVAILRASLSILTFLQLILLYLYQMKFMQQLLPSDELSSRLIGLTALIRTNCSETSKLLLQPAVPWTQFVSPGCIFVLHWILAVGVRMFYQDSQILQHHTDQHARAMSTGVFDGQQESSERKPLVQEEVPQLYGAAVRNDMTPSTAETTEATEDGSAQTYDKKSILLTVSSWFSDVQRYRFYVVALIIMMLWSVTYHSWLTFILLIWSCILWMMRHRAKYTRLCSPVFTVYGILLLLLQYIYSLDLHDSELPTQVQTSNGNTLYLEEFGLRRFEYPCLHLGAQILYVCGFFLVLRQFIFFSQEPHTVQNPGHSAQREKSWTDRLSAFAKELLYRYWIFVVLGFHLAVSTDGYPDAIKIIYMLFFLLNLITYLASWNVWKKTLTLYWSLLVIYTMVVVVLVYTYQFRSFPRYWKSLTNFTDQELKNLGLVHSPTAGNLLVKILVLTLFLLTLILQLQYFNARFLELTSAPTRPYSRQNADENTPRENVGYEMDEIVPDENQKRNWLTESYLPYVIKFWDKLSSLIMRALEFHVWRLVFITVFTAAVYKVSALFALYVLVWVLLLPFTKVHIPLFVITSITSALILLTTMFYQLDIILVDMDLTYNCTFPFYGNLSNHSYHLTDWIGVNKMPRDGAFFYHSQGYIAILLMVALERTVFRRQRWKHLWRNEPAPAVTAFYPSITHKEVDDGLLSCLKFFVNYFFFKFGVEICFVMTIITVWVRTDVFSIIYCILLIIALTLRTKRAQYRFWCFYVCFLMVLIIWQYFSIVGMPPMWCEKHQYPWTTIGTNKTIRNRLVIWLHLPDYIVPVESFPSIADFFQLLFVVSQLFVFQKEASLSRYIGDNHRLTGEELDAVTIRNNPRKNFMLKESRSLLDQCKQFVFKYFFWITMVTIFSAGASRISVFTLGYLIVFFYLLAKQQALLLRKPSFLLKLFTGLLGYTVAVITLKAGLQIASCVYIDTLAKDTCVFVQVMSLVCAKPMLYQVPDQSNDSCELSYDNAGFTSDFICFLFLIIQRRIFTSYYFIHVTEDLKISMQLAARGAELFNEKFAAEAKKRERIQEEELKAIKKSMQAIRDGYSTLHRRLAKEANHVDATRAGDYFMFQDIYSRKDLSKTADEETIMDPLDLIHGASITSIEQMLREREKDKRKLRDEGDTGTDGAESVIKDAEDEEGNEDAPADEGGAPTSSAQGAAKLDEDETQSVGKTEEPHLDQDDCRQDDGEESEQQEEQEEDKEEGFLETIRNGVVFTWELFLSGIDSLTLFLNKQVKDYRNVGLRLAAEKDRLSEKSFREQIILQSGDSQEVVIDIEDENSASSILARKAILEVKYTDMKTIDFDKDQNRVLRLFYALWYVVTSRMDLLCYFLAILNLMLEASMLALIFPLAIFLWSTLSIPRPTKYFWMFAIVYLEFVIVVKFIFQFEFIPWNSEATTNLNKKDPFWWPRFIGIEQANYWAVLDLLQLITVFFHISVLKVNGLWDSGENKKQVTEPSSADDTQEPCTSQAARANHVEEKEKSFEDKLVEIIRVPCNFYNAVLKQHLTSVTDVYVYMFLCDTINFLIIIFGYNAFGRFSSTNIDVVGNLQSNNVPTTFLIMLLIQFVMMFIDRAIYLMKSLYARLIFHICLVIGIHVWLFFILPYLNERSFYENHVAQTYYFFKALYLIISAYQIRVGYPKRVAGNFLTNSYGTVNLFLFKGYRLIPFLAEITAIMNWMYTGTSLGIGDWMRVWAIHAEVFELKCWRVFDDTYPGPRGRAKRLWIKYLIGGLLLFVIFFIIWFPLLLMNIAFTVGGVQNNPVQVEVKITIATFEPIFQVLSDIDDIKMWEDDQFKSFKKTYSDDEAAAAFLQRFSSKQVVTVKIDGESKTIWIISPPQKDLLISRLSSNDSRKLRAVFEWTLTKDAEVSPVVLSYGSNEVFLELDDPTRMKLYLLLTGKDNVTDVTIPRFFPQYVYSDGSSSRSRAASNLYASGDITYRDVEFTIQNHGNDTVTSWWRIFEKPITDDTPMISMVVFSDKVAISSLNFLVSNGIIGLYVSIVLVIGRLIRVIFIGTTATIMFTQLPYVDRILNLLDDIFLVREEAEFELEEDLYAKLLFLYRSPATLIEWSRKPKQE